MRFPTWLLATVLLATPWSWLSAGEQDSAPSFENDIAPLLVRHCLSCHNASELAGGLDLSTPAKSLAGGESGAAAITPGDLDASYLVDRLREGDMPPEGKGTPLSEADRLRIEAWISHGATWPEGRELSALEVTTDLRGGRDWWSLKAPVAPKLPEQNDPWVRSPIDALVLERLTAVGLRPSGDAERAIFLRRICLDVLGLPPTPEEIAAFVGDTSPDAYEKLVDRLLASPRYGERWARHWLDIVRFGESDGYEKNLPRPNAWPYRDWVIEALNSDMPYPEFILYQLAGDQFGVDAATGYLVGGTHDEVQSPDPELTLNQRANDLDDMVSTTTTAFLGLTAGCAKCHDHKFDPIAQRDYFSLQAMFAGVRHGQRELRAADSDTRHQRVDQLKHQIQQLELEADDLTARHQPLAQLKAPAEEARRPAVDPRHNIERFNPVVARFVRFTVLQTGNIEPCIDELEIFSSGQGSRNVALASSGAIAACSSEYGNGESPIHRLEHINDGEYGNGRSWISAEAGGGWVQIELPEPVEIDRITWARDRQGKFKDRLATKYRIDVSVATTQAELDQDAAAWQTVASSNDRRDYDPAAKNAQPRTAGLPQQIAAQVEQLLGQAAELEKQVNALAPATAYLGVFEKPDVTRVYHRGDPMQQRDQVNPGAIAAVGTPLTLPADTPEAERRVALARWLGSNSNPLTARVLVNRIWHYHFGKGLVKTPSDFGFNGGTASHPELLDYLATQLMNGGWRMKAIHREILLSSTYRQASSYNETAASQDADSRWLWRFPPRRLEAEPLRDSILKTTGVLDLRMNGPGYSPFEPNTNYVRVYAPRQDFGPDQWRRMIYQEKPRSRQDGTFGEFDCPDATQVVGRRNVSTTALQALNLLNASFMLQQAELFAKRLESEATTPEEQVRRAFWLALGRAPDGDEQTAAESLIQQQSLTIFCRALLNANEFVYLN